MDFSFLKDKVDYILIGSQSYINECYAAAIINFEKALKETPNNSSALLYKAFSFMAQEDYKNALLDLEQVEKNGDFEYEVFYNKGKCSFYLCDYGIAHENFLKAIAISTSQEQRENVDIWMSKLKTELPKEVLQRLQQQASSSTNTELSFRMTWEQDPKFINLNLEGSKAFDNSNIQIVLEKRNVTVNYNGAPAYNIDLCNSIKKETSSFEIISNRFIKFKLKKEVDDFNWINVDKSKGAEGDNFRQSYPTSSKKKKDWDSIEREIESELRANPEDGPNFLFKEIYARGDEETRRAMIKSFQTSGGTVLSTNWKEVKDKDYEGKDRPEPPKGQEWKKHEV